MVKVKILSSFVDKYSDEVYKVGDTVDFPAERLIYQFMIENFSKKKRKKSKLLKMLKKKK